YIVFSSTIRYLSSLTLFLAIPLILHPYTAINVFFTLSLHDALPILIFGFVMMTMMIPWSVTIISRYTMFMKAGLQDTYLSLILPDRKSTRLNSSHVSFSYAVFCLKKKFITCRDQISDNFI